MSPRPDRDSRQTWRPFRLSARSISWSWTENSLTRVARSFRWLLLVMGRLPSRVTTCVPNIGGRRQGGFHASGDNSSFRHRPRWDCSCWSGFGDARAECSSGTPTDQVAVKLVESADSMRRHW